MTSTLCGTGLRTKSLQLSKAEWRPARGDNATTNNGGGHKSARERRKGMKPIYSIYSIKFNGKYA